MPSDPMFSNAAAYERFMGQWSAPLARWFADFALPAGSGRILDVGCGTGSMIGAIRDKGRAAAIVGIDPSPEFIGYSRSRFAGTGIAIDQGSALELPYPAAAFHHSVSCLVFHLIPDPDTAAREMRRVTRAGGTVAACTWNLAALERVAILWQEQIKLDPAAEEHQETSRRCSRDGDLTRVWQGAGLVNIEETDFRMTMDFGSFDDYWLPLLDGVGPTGAYVARLAAPAQRALREALRRRLLGGRADGPISLGARALAVRGTVPGSVDAPRNVARSS